jgi:hypothetical protein
MKSGSADWKTRNHDRTVKTMGRLMTDHAAGTAVRDYQAPELPVLHLGPMARLHRRDIYDDVC